MIAILVLLAALAMSAVCAGSETAYYAMNKLKLRHLARTGRRAAILERTLRSPAGFLSTLLVGNNIANDAAVHAARDMLGRADLGNLELWTTLVLTPVIFLVGEVGPEQYMLADPLRRSMILAPVLAVTRLVLMPVTIPLVALTRWLNREEEGAVARHQLSAYLMEGRHGLDRNVKVLAAARRVVESHGRGLQAFLHRQVAQLRHGAPPAEVRAALHAAPDGIVLLERPGRSPALLTGAAALQAGPEHPLESQAVDLPVLPPGLDLAEAFGSLRRLGGHRALVGRPGAWEGLFDLEYALSLLLAPESPVKA